MNVRIQCYAHILPIVHGEDMQMGMLLHRLNKGFQMKVVGNVSVPTATPVVCLSSVLLHAVYVSICLFFCHCGRFLTPLNVFCDDSILFAAHGILYKRNKAAKTRLCDC
jgi:hypothetical protein